MFNITIVTVNWFNVEYILSVLKNLHAKAKHPENLSVLIVDNTNGKDESLQKLNKSKIAFKILSLDNRGFKGSIGHAWALDHAMKHLKSEYSVVVDPDIYVFKKYWDEFCLLEMKKTGSIAIGAPYPKWKVGKYHDFPSPPFCFFHTRTIKNMKHGWEPYGSTIFHNALTFLVRQVGRMGSLLTRQRFEKHALLRNYAAISERMFGVFSQDTGWKLAEEVRTKRFKTIVFDSVLHKDNFSVSKIANEAFQAMVREYEVFSYNKELILTHKYGTSGIPWRTKFGSDLNYWMNCIKKVEESLHETRNDLSSVAIT